MAELDRFEVRFVTAYRRYLAEAPVEVDAVAIARQVAAAAPRRHALAGFRPFGLSPVLAWTVLLAALLAALVGGALLVGSQQRKLPAVVPPVGQVFECPPGSNPDEPGRIDQARPAGLTWPPLTLDRRAGKLVALTGIDIVETWTFDLCTNTWTRMHPNREPPQGTGQLVYDVDSDVTIAIAFDGTRLWVYDLKTNTWTEKGPIPPFNHFELLLFYDPISGHVVALGDDDDEDSLGLELWGYEVETDTWTPLRVEPLVIGAHYGFFAYDASVDRLVAYARSCPYCENSANPPPPTWAKTWLFDLRTGTWSGTSAVTPPDFTAGAIGMQPAIAYDEAAQRIVILGQGHAAAYDATADRWETLFEGSTAEDSWAACGTRPECRHMPSMVYDPVNERLVVHGGLVWSSEETEWVFPDDDWLAFDTRTREWTVLLEASPAQPAP